MDKEVWIAIIGACGGIALTGVIEIVKKIIDSLSKKHTEQNGLDEAIKQGVCELLYTMIDDKCHKYISRGSITLDEKRDLNRQWDIYHFKLGGNGYLDDVMSAVKDLPIK